MGVLPSNGEALEACGMRRCNTSEVNVAGWSLLFKSLRPNLAGGLGRHKSRNRALANALRIDRTKRHYPIPLQLGAGDNSFLEPRARHGVHPWLATLARPVAQSLNAFLFIERLCHS
jgi:hypothetical protein